MPAPATADEFLEFVRKSGVAEETRLKVSLQRMTEQAGVPNDPSELAKMLMRDGVLTFFQADQLLQGKWKRFFIGKYKVLERLGSGGMGQVFLCEHKLMRRRVAVKVLPAARAEDSSALERFYREARLVAALDHPNIVRAYDIDQDDKLHFLVMEYVDGSNLQDLIKKHGVLDPVRACHYVYGSAVGLQHAHEMGLVHRDIKPGNILVDRTGVVKILDLGLARFFNDEDDLLTRKYDENILGTADYLAPEQAIDSHTVDIRADIYSLGATFYFMLTGQPPFPEGSVAQKLLWHQTREPAPLQTLRPDVPAELVEINRKMMAKDVKDRFQTPSQVMAALSRWVQTPIPPPTDKEMPTLSPALMTGMSGPLTTKLPSAVSPGDAPASSTGPSSIRPVVAPPSVSPAPLARPAESAPPPSPPVMPPPVSSEPVPPVQPSADALWQSIADEPSPLPPVATRRDGNPPASTEPKPGPSKSLAIILLGVCFLLGLLGTSALAYFFWLGPSSADTSAAHKTWYVSADRSSSPNPDRTLMTLRGAVEQAGSEEIIVILEPRLEEPPFVFADPQGKKKGLRIESGISGQKPVVWAPKQALVSGSRATLELVDVENLHLSGLVFELNNAIETGITVKGTCYGTTLENLTVRNSRVAGFRLQGASGEANRPLTLKNCRVATVTNIEAGIMITGQARETQLLGNLFETPGGAALKAEGLLRDVVFKNNRVFNADHGLWLSGRLPDDAGYAFTVANNTFHTIAKAGLYCDLPLKQPKQFVNLNQNLFLSTQALLMAEPAATGLNITANARDAASAEGNPTSQAVIISVDIPAPTALIDDTQFLRPKAGSAQLPSGESVGAP